MMIKFIIIVIFLIYYINIIHCDDPYPTINNVTVLADSETYGFNIQINGSYLTLGNYFTYNAKQIYFNSTNTTITSWSLTSNTTYIIDLNDYQSQNNLLVNTNVIICGKSQTSCSNPQPGQIFHFNPPPFCNQTGWPRVDAGTSNITITGQAFRKPPLASYIEFTARDGSTKTSNIDVISSNVATFEIPFTSGFGFTISKFIMNETNVVSILNQFSFNPPKITSIDLLPSFSTYNANITGSSFGVDNNNLIKVTVYLGGKQESLTVFANSQTSLILSPVPLGSLLLIVGKKTVMIELDGNISNYTYTTNAKIISHKIDNTMITINLYNVCNSAIIDFGNNIKVDAQSNNKVVSSIIPASARNGNVTLSCYGAESTPFPIKLTPTLNYSSSSNTTGTIITIYGQFISPLNSLNQQLPISINISKNNESCTNITYVSDGVTTCIAPPGAGNNTTLSITIDGVSSTTTIPLIYNKPSISNYTYDIINNNTIIYLEGYNFGDNDQVITIKFKDVLYNATHIIPHQKVKFELGKSFNITSSGTLELIVDGQSSIPFNIQFQVVVPGGKGDGSGGGGGRDDNLKWVIPLVFILISGCIILFIVFYKRMKNKSKKQVKTQLDYDDPPPRTSIQDQSNRVALGQTSNKNGKPDDEEEPNENEDQSMNDDNGLSSQVVNI